VYLCAISLKVSCAAIPPITAETVWSSQFTPRHISSTATDWESKLANGDWEEEEEESLSENGSLLTIERKFETSSEYE
jgi:hypothetical protein